MAPFHDDKAPPEVQDAVMEAYEQIKELNATVERLDSEIIANNMPHVIVEGPTDKIIMEEAYKRIYPEQNPICEFIHSEGASNIPPYLKICESAI